MTTLLILFFLSLIGISFMIGKKLVLMKNGNIVHEESVHKVIPDFQTIKYVVSKKAKQSGYVATVIVVRTYVQSSNFLKNAYTDIKEKIKNWKQTGEQIEKKEASKFLKMISDYKYKVKSIKRKIEEENKQV
jgi:hypothetical protein